MSFLVIVGFKYEAQVGMAGLLSELYVVCLSSVCRLFVALFNFVAL